MDLNYDKLLKTITKASKKEAEEAKNKIMEIANNRPSFKEQEDIILAFFLTLMDFEKIKKVSNLAIFIQSLEALFPMFKIKDEEFFHLIIDFILNSAQDPNKEIRQAAVETALLIPSYLEINQIDNNDLSQRVEMFCAFVAKIEFFIEEHHRKKFDKVEYIYELPDGVYKSLQFLIAEIMFNKKYEEIYDNYLNRNKENYSLDKVLPEIKLKYYNKLSDKKATNNDFQCAQCKKVGIKIGSASKDISNPKYYCEDCAIKNYKEEYGFKTLKAAASWRRRTFDVGYLFNEIIIDNYLIIFRKKIDDLSDSESQYLYNLANDLHNNIFSKEEKIFLESIEDQSEIEEKIKEKLINLDFYQIFGKNSNNNVFNF
jgi:hypothetical protein